MKNIILLVIIITVYHYTVNGKMYGHTKENAASIESDAQILILGREPR